MPSSGEQFEGLLEAMRKAAATLRDASIPFALAGGLAVWAHGGPDTDHDVDFIVKKDDVDRALEALEKDGFRGEKPPEGWLVKVYDGDCMIDLIFAPTGMKVDDDVLARADEMEVYAIRLRVLSVTDILATKLLALKEHELDYDSLLEIARSCREQVRWDDLRERTKDHPYALPFFTLVKELGIAA
jgi:putative nucleotidyltransferase-like protein